MPPSKKEAGGGRVRISRRVTHRGNWRVSSDVVQENTVAEQKKGGDRRAKHNQDAYSRAKNNNKNKNSSMKSVEIQTHQSLAAGEMN